jgi:DNA polymerase-3 subunit delta
MTGTVEEAVAEIVQGRRSPVYLLHGDECVAKEGAKAIVNVLVPPGQQSLSVEVVAEENDLASLPLRLRTLPLFGGTKVVVLYDSKAFVSREGIDTVVKRSIAAWQDGDAERATRLFLQAVGAVGEGQAFLDRASRGEVSAGELDRVLATEVDPEKVPWLQEVAKNALIDGASIPEATGAGLARVYEDVIQQGIPPNAVLILTTEVVDERRVLFKRIRSEGFLIDCGVRTRRAWDTQMEPEAARTKIRQMVAAAGKTLAPDAVTSIVERTGISMRALESELEKILLYVGPRSTISMTDAVEVLSNSREANIFDLTSAVNSRDTARAVRAFRSLMTQREPVPQILGMLASEIRALIMARSALDRRLGGKLDPGMLFPSFQFRLLPLLTKAVEGDDGAASKLVAMKPFRAFKLLQGAARFSLTELEESLEAIHETDLALKTSGHPAELLLEQLLIGICRG